jgi:general secretion pathway protein G
MNRSRSLASPRRRSRPGGFTLVELLVVILILAVLIALLLPAINGAVRTAKNAAVGGEINSMAQALASFKAKYGEYPPSRIYLAENGDYSAVGNTTQINPGDITLGQLAQRSLAALRKFFPNVTLSTAGAVFGAGSPRWYDFNGNGGAGPDAPYILQGHQCLVFFLGGIPFHDSSGAVTMTGFGKDPRNPFTNNIVGTGMYSNNRSAPMFEFAPTRLVLDPSSSSGIPGYFDSLGNSLGGGQINFYAYFSAYGNAGYDPNDVNFPAEVDVNNAVAALAFRVAFPVVPPAIAGVPNTAGSAGPNPYTTTSTVPVSGGPTYYNPQTFQIISAGNDGLYGLGGQYNPDVSAPLTLDANGAVYLNTTTDAAIRAREKDNVSNFHSGKLD